ncbi:MAG: phage portal protein [Planctomycetaceae bacterium]|nr:phage portal protein [Planctomycetaceae bacterium]
MWGYVRDRLAVMRMRAAAERRVQERLAELVESRAEISEGGTWISVGSGKEGWTNEERRAFRDRARAVVRENPHARNILRLLEAYVVGDGLKLTLRSRGEDEGETASGRMTELWEEFLEANGEHFSYGEFARRVWRDGECFVRIFEQATWPPEIRFVDPERVRGIAGDVDDDGVVSELDDVEKVLGYRVYHRDGGDDLFEVVPADRMLHVKYGVDTNERRGMSFFASLVDGLERYGQWQETELAARKLQSSIVLWRKVQGGLSQAQDVLSRASSGVVRDGDGMRSERIRPGSIVTTSTGTEMKFLQPDTNFGDAVPLGRMLLLCVAAGAGLPEFMLTGDASNGNYASTMIAEGPAVKLFRNEQRLISEGLGRLWKLVMDQGVETGVLDSRELRKVERCWVYPELVSRDRPREREVDVRLIEAGVLSRAEVQRREKLDPRQVEEELAKEILKGGDDVGDA